MSSQGTTGGEQPSASVGGRLSNRPLSWLFALLLGGTAIFLSSFYAERNLPFQDEGATLTAAARILRGEVFYRDIDAYPFPGAAYLAAGAMAEEAPGMANGGTTAPDAALPAMAGAVPAPPSWPSCACHG